MLRCFALHERGSSLRYLIAALCPLCKLERLKLRGT